MNLKGIFPLVILLATFHSPGLATIRHTLQSESFQKELIKGSAPRSRPQNSNQRPAQQKTSILQRIESYKAPPMPADAFGDGKETYDHRLDEDVPTPPTLVDTFISDLYQRITIDLRISSRRRCNISQGKIMSALDIYMDRDWAKIAGYRPWTHWNFVRSLDESSRKILGKEVLDYVLKEGIKDSENELLSCKQSEQK
jgi:hypothetical protein